MGKDHSLYLKWIIDELNNGLELNPFSAFMYTPIAFKDAVARDGTILQPDRLFVASEIYRWVLGGKWRLLDLENMISLQKGLDFKKSDLRKDIKHLIDNQEILNADVLKMCLLLTGIKHEIVNDPEYALHRREIYKPGKSKLWASIGYYDMRQRAIHIIKSVRTGKNELFYAAENVIETAAHELGHHIYISLITKRYKTKPSVLKRIRQLVKGVRISKSAREHAHWIKFYKWDYAKDWDRNKKLQLISRSAYIRYGLESELFAQIISGKSTMSKAKRKEIIALVNQAILV